MNYAMSEESGKRDERALSRRKIDEPPIKDAANNDLSSLRNDRFGEYMLSKKKKVSGWVRIHYLNRRRGFVMRCQRIAISRPRKVLKILNGRTLRWLWDIKHVLPINESFHDVFKYTSESPTTAFKDAVNFLRSEDSYSMSQSGTL